MLHYIRSFAAAAIFVGSAVLAANAQSTTIASPPSASSPTPVPAASAVPENPLVTARVTKEFLAWQRGKIERSSYSPFAGGTYDDALVAVVAPDLRAVGAPQSTTYRTASLLLGDLVYRYDVAGTGGTISVLYFLNQAGQTDGIAFTPRIFTPAAVPSPTP